MQDSKSNAQDRDCIERRFGLKDEPPQCLSQQPGDDSDPDMRGGTHMDQARTATVDKSAQAGSIAAAFGGHKTAKVEEIDLHQPTDSLGRSWEESPQVAHPVDLQRLLSARLPPREWLVEGFMQERDLAMVHAYRGVGKSRFVHGLAVALAAGGQFLGFSAPVPQDVLLVDGELPREDLQKMLAEAVTASEKEPTSSLRILSADLSEAPLQSLATDAGRQHVEKHLDKSSLLILDSITTLCPGAGPENDAESWEEMQAWLLDLRRGGYAVLLVHHEGKSGLQRGTSKREDVLSQVVQLKRPQDYRPSEGARFELHFTKSRGLVGAAADPIEARLQHGPDGSDIWTYKSLEDAVASTAKALADGGLTQREIGTEMGIGLGTVNRALQRAREQQVNACSSVPAQASETRNTEPSRGTGGGT